ncbi:hypothetical protein Tco_1058759 [Tanacetum coccineum]|uniref:Uncharacterized protein n=1 Tax=Tanacetum coccineum TaxID=301880 RepID=A0ABQ5HAX2_9ASTR
MTSTHQQSLVNDGSETLSPMLERGTYLPWSSQFMRYIERKRDTRKFLKHSIKKCPYKMKDISATDTAVARPQTKDDLTGDDLKQYEADIEAMNLILLSIPNDIYNSVDACKNARDMWVRVKRLMQGTELSKIERESRFLNEFDKFTSKSGESRSSGDDICDDQEDSLTTIMMLLARAITKHYSTPTNNRLRTSSNIRNQAIVQADRVVIQSRNVRNGGKYARSSYGNQGESADNENDKEIGKGNGLSKAKSSDSKYFLEQIFLAKKDEAGIILTNKHNDFLLMNAYEIEELDDLSANICMMARNQQTNSDSKNGPNYDSTFISEVQNPSTSFMNPLFSQSDHEQTYHEQHEIIKSTIGNDQINSDIIFDDLNVEVNDGNVEHDKNAHDQQDNAMKLLARNAYKEAEKQQIIAKQYIEADKRAKKLEIQFQALFIQDRDKIMALEIGKRRVTNIELDETLKQNEILKEKLLEATLIHDVEKCVLMCLESTNDILNDEIKKVKSESKDVQENLLKLSRFLRMIFKDVKRKSLILNYNCNIKKKKRIVNSL